MKIIEVKDYQNMSQQAAAMLISCLKEKPDALICIATGGSPTESYRLFAEKVKSEQLDTSRLRIIGLDEWCGMEKNHPATCEYYIRKHLLEPLSIPDSRFIAFLPQAPDIVQECRRIEELLNTQGGIDLCILGIGRNGHLGLNEPATELNPFVHQAVLDSKTREHAMLVSTGQTARAGCTLGIKNILDSKKVLLLITGSGKEEAYRNLCRKKITSQLPANYLWLHDQALCIVDSESVTSIHQN